MERYTKQSKKYILQLLHTICMFCLSLFFLYSFILNIMNAHSFMQLMLSLMVLCFALSIWASLYISYRSLKTIIFVDEEGMGIKRFNKIRVYLRYRDIREIGTGKATTLSGEKQKLYFSSRILTKEEKENLDLLQNEIIYFTDLSIEWKQYIEKYSGLHF